MTALYVQKPAETTGWQGAPVAQPFVVRQPTTNTTSKQKLWRWDYAPDPPWQMPVEWENSAPIQILGHKPAAQKDLWRYDLVPQPDWQMPIDWQNSALIQILNHLPTSKQKLWRWDYVPQPDWQMPSAYMASDPNYIPTKVTEPFYKLWRFDYVSQPDWLGQPVAVPISYTTPSTVQSRSAFYAPRPAELQYWNASPQPAFSIRIPVVLPFFNPKQFNLVPDPPWVWQPPPSPILRQLDFTTTSPTKLWRWDYVPQPDWLGTPLPANTLFDLLRSGEPFNKLWRWDLVPQPDWIGRPQPSYASYIPPTFPTSPTKLWRWDYVPQPDWLGQPVANFVALTTAKTASPFTKSWRFDYVPQPDWVGTPLAAHILQAFDHKPTSPTKLWRWDLDNSSAFWQFVYTRDTVLLITPPPKPISYTNHSNYNALSLNIDTYWVGGPVAVPIVSYYTPPPPPVIPTRRAVKNIFPVQFYYGLSTLAQAVPPNPLLYPSKVFVNQPANVIIKLERPVVPDDLALITFVRPDGSTYYVSVSSPYMFIGDVFGQLSIIYTTALNELNQRGWWSVTFTLGDSISNPFAFYIW